MRASYSSKVNNASATRASGHFKTEQRLLWDDARIVLAVRRAGSLTGAAAQLGVSHPTVFRRIRDVEAGFGVRLFERSRSGYVATVAGEAVAEAAAAMEERFIALERRLHGADLRPAGAVRITTADTLMASFLPALLHQLCARFPEIKLEVSTSNAPFDLSRREADVALRFGREPPSYLVGRRLGEAATAVYRAGRAAAPRRLADASWVGPGDSLSHLASYRWIADAGFAERIALRANSFVDIRHAIRAGIGIGILPCYLGDSDPALRRVGVPLPALSSPFWILTHPDLQRVVRIRAVMETLPALIEPLRDLLAGRRPHPRR
jgi:DNA-binding transcriptional LysR family regulator